MGGVFYPLLIRLFLEAVWYYLLISILKFVKFLMYDVTMTSFLCFHQRKGIKDENVIMTSNCKFMLLFELSGPNLASIPNF